MSEDLSLGLILDDRDDSVFAGGWSDEDEELEDEFVCTPRHLPTLDENDDSETDFNLQHRRLPSRYSMIFIITYISNTSINIWDGIALF